MKLRAKKIRIVFDNSSEDYWESTCESGIKFNEAMSMIAKAWKEHDEPKEPLIKDERIRKCVRLWAEINEFKGKLMYSKFDDCCTFYEADSQEELLFLNRKCSNLKHAVKYSVAELCGDSEEDEDEA